MRIGWGKDGEAMVGLGRQGKLRTKQRCPRAFKTRLEVASKPSSSSSPTLGTSGHLWVHLDGLESGKFFVGVVAKFS